MSTEPIPISVVILCHNEADNLPRCIQALKGCDDVVVLDDGSTDDSRELATSLGARVVTHPFISFADQRNWAMEHASLIHDWVLHLDTDEVMTPEAMHDVHMLISGMQEKHVGFIARKVMLGEAWLRYSAGYPVYVPRIVHRKGPRFVMRGHGEWMDVLASDQIFLKSPVMHFNFSKGWSDWWERHNRYSSAEADRIRSGLPPFSIREVWAGEKTVRRGALRAFSYRIPGRPFFRFLYGYLFKLGFLDGRAGFDFCLAMAAYEHMIDVKVRESKLS